MQSLRGFGDWLKDVAKLPWGQLAKQGIDATKATADLSKTWQELTPKLAQLENLEQIDRFFKAFDSPIAKLTVSGLPFVSVGIELLRLYWSVTQTKPTLEHSIVLSAQMAYLESLGQSIDGIKDARLSAQLKEVKLAVLFKRQLTKLETIELTKEELLDTLTDFRGSALATALNSELTSLLIRSGIAEAPIDLLVEQVSWGTPQYLHLAVAGLKDVGAELASYMSSGGLQVQQKYRSIEQYLKKTIDPLAKKLVFDEVELTFKDLYVPLSVQRLESDGEKLLGSPLNIDDWARGVLSKQGQSRQVMFLEGEAGRGKSVFCQMFASWVRKEFPSAWKPILIRLRDVDTIKSTLRETLEIELQNEDFVQRDRGWLTDPNVRFLLILDGFDELFLQGREGDGLKDFLQQVAKFQKDSQHQCLITGRPLALQGIDQQLKRISNLERVRLEPMTDDQREQWLTQWGAKFGRDEALTFCDFLAACPQDIRDNLAREPLLLYLLGRLHRDNRLNAQMFAGTEGMQAKVLVYDESVKWVLEQQRQEVSEKIFVTAEDLRQVLQEAALCVVQSGNETAKLTMLKSRFADDDNPVAVLLKQAQTEKTEDKMLNNLLTAFYLKPGEGDKTGSVEFAHKSFGEFLFAERLKAAFDDWVELDKRNRPRLNETEVARQIYDLLGYGALTVEVVDYLKELLFAHFELDELVQLFQQLHQFYMNWCDGIYIDKAPSENLPQGKMMQMGKLEIPLGLRQVDIYAGLNVMILLFQLHRHGQQKVVPSEGLKFHPCGDLEVDGADRTKLLRIIGYSQVIGINVFSNTVGFHLSRADLSGANLSCADLSRADLSRADFSGADLYSANLYSADLCSANLHGAELLCAKLNEASLSGANLSSANLVKAHLYGAELICAELIEAELHDANLIDADLSGANLSGANLGGADLGGANLTDIYWDAETVWNGVKGLETARNLPEDLRQQLGLD